MTTNSLDQFVRQFSELQRRLKSVERASQGSRRSVVGGGVTVFDPDGTTVRGVVGLQPDGTTAFTTVNDPIPPMPTAAIIYPVAGGLEITWDGTFWANIAAPADLAYIEVHASPYSVYTPDSSSLRAKLHRGGSTVTVSLPADPYTVVFVAVTTGGSRSNPSVPATETPSLALTATDLAIIESAALRAQEIADTAQARADQAVTDAAAATAAAEAAEAASAAVTGAAAAAQTAADQAASDAAAALAQAQAAGSDADAAQTAADAAKTAADAAKTAAGTAGTAASAADAKAAQAAADAAQAIADAAKAQTAANAAKSSADAANTAAGTAKGIADAAKAAAETAQSTANTAKSDAATANNKALEAAGIAAGKGKVYYGTTAPAADPNGLWIDTTGGANTPKRHNGTAWVAVTDKAATDAASAAATAQARADKAVTDAATAASAAAAAKAAADAAQETANGAKTDAATALTAANGKNKVFYLPSTTPPTGTLITNDLWFQTDKGNAPYKRTSDGTWVDASFGDGAIAALNVGKLVTGSISAGVRIIAGAEQGTHAELSSTGLRVFRDDPVDGVPDEAVRLGTETNDFFGIPDANGNLVASIDDTGRGNFRTVSADQDITVGGRSLTSLLRETTTGSLVARYVNSLGSDLFPIRAEIGLVETNAFLDRTRVYEVSWSLAWKTETFPAEVRVRVRSTPPSAEGSNDAAVPMANGTSYEEQVWNIPQGGADYFNSNEGTVRIYPARSGRHRFLLTIEQGANSGGSASVIGSRRIDLSVRDLGSMPPQVGSISRGGGSLYQGAAPPPPPPPTQQYVWESRFDVAESYRGDGTRRTDIPAQDVVQGWDPSGYNGDGYGYYGFRNKPNITGTVDRVDIYLYSWHWYYNSGGTAVINMTPWSGFIGGGFPKLAPGGDWRVGGFARPGGRWLTVPADWWPHFRTAGAGGGAAAGITLGRTGGTDLAYYGKFNDCRLKIWYTQ